MQNSNKSNQLKSWKYTLISSILSAFILLFHMETVAQVKEQNITIGIEKKKYFETTTFKVEIVNSNSKIQEARYLTFDNGDQLVYYNKTLKIPGEPALKINTYNIYIDDVKIDADKFIKIETLNYKKYRYNKKGNILKLYSK
jgi:hypothetical protein